MTDSIIGIDLGTTNTCVSFLTHENKPKVIPNHLGFPTTPSFVTYTHPHQNLNELINNISKKLLRENIKGIKTNSTDNRNICQSLGDIETKLQQCKKNAQTIVNQPSEPSKNSQTSNNYAKNDLLNPNNLRRQKLGLEQNSHFTNKEPTSGFRVLSQLFLKPFCRIFSRNLSDSNLQISSNKIDKTVKSCSVSPDNEFIANIDMFYNRPVIIGHVSKALQNIFPLNTIFAFKRLIGRKSRDPGLIKYINSLSYKTHAEKNGDLYINIPTPNKSTLEKTQNGFVSASKMCDGSQQSGSGDPSMSCIDTDILSADKRKSDSSRLTNIGINKDSLQKLSPVQISAHLLQYMKKCAENYLKVPVEKAVITVPAYFNDTQRSATKMAGKLAGLDVVRVLSEPTAAALAYGLNQKDHKIIVVYDLGGGTFDVSVLEMENGVFEVKSVNGDSHLGGEDIDIAIMNDAIQRIKSLEESAKNDSTSTGVRGRLGARNMNQDKTTSFTTEKSKEINAQINKNDTHDTSVDIGCNNVQKSNFLNETLHLSASDVQNHPSLSFQQNQLLNSFDLHNDSVLHYNAGENLKIERSLTEPQDGGLKEMSGAKIFRVRNFSISELKNQAEQLKIFLSNNDKCYLMINIGSTGTPKTYVLPYSKQDVADIAAPLIERTIEKCSLALKDANITKEQVGHIILVGGATKMPLVREHITKYFSKHPNTSVDPDLAVSLGASIQAGIIDNRIDAVLLDVNSLSLGIETIGGLFSKVIERNSKIPVKKSQIYTNSEDNQQEVVIRIYQGERPLVKMNKFLGEFKLINLEKRKKGEHRIEVVFECDVNGILFVRGKDLLTNKEQQIVLKQESGLSEDEISRIIEESQQLKDQDAHLVKCAEFQTELRKLQQNPGISSELAATIQKYLIMDTFDVTAARKDIQRFF